MSVLYIQRLRDVQAKFDATSAAISYFNWHWQKQDVPQRIKEPKPKDLMRADQNLELTYFIRLHAEFEGILKDHLATNHPRVRVPEKPKVDWLTSRVLQSEGVSLEQPLRLKLTSVRDYRNSIAHRTRRGALFISFGDALSVLNTFLARLPEPLR